jgi:hypothetical protein
VGITKLWILNSIFVTITKEEMQRKVEHGFTILKTMVEEKTLQVKVAKCPIGT